MEYTFEDWLNGIQEPSGFNWIYEKESLKKSSIKDSVFPKRNPVYLEISKAKKFAFDKALEFSLDSMKSYFYEKIEDLNDSKRKMYIEKSIEDSEKHFKKYDIIKLIDHSPPNKFEGINGAKYLEVKKQVEGLNRGDYHRCVTILNEAHLAVLHFEISEYYREVLSAPNLKLELQNKSEKGETIAVKFKLLDKFFQGKEEFKNLLVKDQEKLLGYILGGHHDTVKHVKNFSNKRNPDGKYITQDSIDRFNDLYIKIKKGDLL